MKFDINKYTRYGLFLGIFIGLTIPPYIVYWKENSMRRMGKGVKDDIERIKNKGKTLYDIPRIYKSNDISPRKDSDFYYEIQQQLKQIEQENSKK